jgi:predicted hydrocarbon binding protein
MPKIENPLLISLYSYYVEKILSETSNIDEANQRLRDLGNEIGQQVYLNTEIVDKTKDNVTTREDVSKLIEIVYRILFDKKPKDIDMKTARGSVRITDDNCVWCQEVNLEGMRGFGYCEVFSGILESVLEFKGVSAKVFQEMSQATGAEACVWNVRLV